MLSQQVGGVASRSIFFRGTIFIKCAVPHPTPHPRLQIGMLNFQVLNGGTHGFFRMNFAMTMGNAMVDGLMPHVDALSGSVFYLASATRAPPIMALWGKTTGKGLHITIKGARAGIAWAVAAGLWPGSFCTLRQANELDGRMVLSSCPSRWPSTRMGCWLPRTTLGTSRTLAAN